MFDNCVYYCYVFVIFVLSDFLLLCYNYILLICNYMLIIPRILLFFVSFHVDIVLINLLH